MNAVKIYEDACRAVDRSEITIGEFEKRIEPLKDVESVVRCKDCERYYANGGNCEQVLADWFCADGKRREDDGTTEWAEPEAGMVS